MDISKWIWTILILSGGLFAYKIVYLICVAVVLPQTQGAIYVPTTRRRIDAVLDAVPMAPDKILIDLGCGDGRFLRAAKKRYKVYSIGYEINPMAYLKAKTLGRGIDIRFRNFFRNKLPEADIIFCYLFPDVMPALSVKLKAEAKPRTVIISCNFPIPEFSPQQILRPNGTLHSDPIFIYHF